MYTLTLHARIDQGILQIDAPIEVPNDIPDGEHEIRIAIGSSIQPSPLIEWPEGFFARTYGAFADEPLERPDQGMVEVRDALG